MAKDKDNILKIRGLILNTEYGRIEDKHNPCIF